MVDDGALPRHEVALLDMMAGVCNETEIERQVVDAGDLHSQQLLCLEEVVEVGLGGYAVDVAAVRVNRTEVHLPLLVAHVHRALVGEEHSVAAVTGRHYAVEHVDTTLDGFEDVLWSSYAHQVARLVLRQKFRSPPSIISYITSVGSPTARPPMAFPSAALVGYVLGSFAAQLGEGTDPGR